MPLLGTVPLVFYLPPGTDQDNIDFILSHGGQVSNIVECFTFQISLISVKSASGVYDPGFSKKQPNPKSYFAGNIYSFDWILDSIKAGQMILPVQESYFLMQIPYPTATLTTNAGHKK